MAKPKNNNNSSDEQEISTMALIWPMVSISKQKLIFPPSNHENLSISIDSTNFISDSVSDSSSSDSGSISDSDSNSSFSPSDSNSPVFSTPKKLPVTNDVSSMRFVCWIINTVCSRFYSVVNYLWKSFGFSKNVVFKTVFVVLCFLYFRQRKRLRDGERGRRGLVRVIDEKELKINRLLDQVSRMNQVLLGLHKAPMPT